jgi:predicted Ser/Thr protein kinase
MATRFPPLAFALGLSLGGAPAGAQEWHDAYRSGLSALARGDAERAVEALRRAVALRPEPGRNVVTYGTNVEPRYFPYLRLAEAYLALGQLEAAQQALEASARWAREPAEDRQKLLARLDAAADERRPRAPPSTPTPATPTPAPTTITTLAPPASAAPEPPVTVASAPPPPAVPSPPVTRETPPARGAPRTTTPAMTSIPASERATGALEIVSQPAGAAVYIDDEPVGSTDPETGRLVKTGLVEGRHRVRVAYAGHEEVARDIDVPAGGRASFTAALGTLRSTPSGFGPLSFALVAMALALVCVLVWVALRRAPESPPPLWAPTPRAGRTDAPAPSTPGKLSPGARRDEHGQEWFGEFRLLEMLGRGGMASVFKAERRNELSALKRPLSLFLDDPQFLERFLREAEIGRTLNHPNIVRILERGEVEGVPYFTMELVEGQTLDAFVRARGPADPRTAASIVVHVAEALDFAHTKGVIHRDLKPSNIMLLPDGRVKVMDFGIARARRFEGLTATGAFLGTPEYVAPEMIEGSGTEPRSDLYGLGVIFFELLTGQRPFTGDTPFAILRKHATEEAPAPSRLEHGVPPELDAIVRHLLRKDPAERPASAEELVVTLRDWLNRAA